MSQPKMTTRQDSRRKLTPQEMEEGLRAIEESGLLLSEQERVFREEVRSIAEEGFPEGGVPFKKVEPLKVVQNYCSVCFCPLGPENPRQLCRKTFCENADFVFDL